MTDPEKHFLISDADREHVMLQLQDAMAKGFINAEELSERSDRALAARTRGDLDPIAQDLPPGLVPYVGSATAVPQSDVVVLRGTSASLKRKGNWQVPRRLVLERRKGSTELDFSQAQIDHPVVEIEIAIDGGSLEMRLPEGASASLDGIEVTRGSVEDHRRNPAVSGRPHFVITGWIRWGSVEVRGPAKRLFGRG